MSFRRIRAVLAVSLAAVGVTVAVTTAGQPAGAAVQVAGTLVSTAPTRLMDTRLGLGGSVVGPGETLSLTVLGVGPIPETGVSAVVLNVTAVAPTSTGYLTVWPDGVTRPTASNLNFVKGQTVPNLVVAQVGSDGKVDFFNSAGSTQLVADVSGYYLSGSPTVAGAYATLTPARLLDTRSHVGGSAPNGGGVVKLQVSGRGGVPSSGVSAVVLNVTVTQPTSSGYVTVWADNTTRPTASNLNFVKGQTVPNLVVAPVGADGKVDLFNSAGTTQLLADVSGYFKSGTPTSPGAFVSTAPTRFLDTRSRLGGVAPGSGRIVRLQVDQRSPLPAQHVAAVVLNVTVTAPTENGYITVWADGQPQPTASNLNFVKGQTVPNLVVAPVGADGKVDLFNSLGTTQLIADVAGYVVADTTPPGPVTSVTATASGTTVALAWNNPTDADFAGVQIRRIVGTMPPTLTTGTLAGNTVGSTSSFTDTGLTPNTQYSYALFAFDNAGNFATAASPASVTTPPVDTTPPGPVTGVAESAAPTAVTLTWTNPSDTDFAGVLIVRKIGSAPTSTTDGTTVTATTSAVTRYTDTGLTASTSYFYALFAFDTSTNYAPGVTIAAPTSAPDTTPPGPVTNLTATPDELTVQLAWTNPTNADFAGVTIVRKAGSTPPASPTDGTVVANTAAVVTQFTDVGQTPGTNAGLTANTQYSYAVFAFDTSGNDAAAVTASATTPTSGAITTPGPVIQAPPSTVTADALPTVQIDGVAWSQVIVGNTVYVGGSFANARPAGAAVGTNQVARTDMLAYNLQTGVLINSFAPVFNGQVRALAVSPDGTRLYAAGDFTTVNGTVHNRIVAFNAVTGALISSFTASLDAGVHAIVATNTAVYVGGLFANANGSARTRLAEFNSTAGALTTWNASADSTVNALVLTPDGTELVVGGAFQNLDGVTVDGLGAVTAASGTSVNWGNHTAATGVYAYGTGAAIESLATDGNAVYGSAYNFHGTGNLEGAFSADPDTGAINWIEDCHGDTYDVFPVNGIVYTVSHAHYCANDGGWLNLNPEVQKHSMAFTAQATGVLLHDSINDSETYPDHGGVSSPSIIDWFPDFTTGTVTGQDQAAWTVTGNSQYVIEGGEFPTVNNTAQQGLVRFAVRPIAPAVQGPRITGSHFVPTATPTSDTTVQLNFTANWDRDDQTLYYKLVRNSNTAHPIWTQSADSQWWTATAASPTPAFTFTDTGLTQNTTYRYRLYVSDADGNTVAGDTVTVTTLNN